MKKAHLFDVQQQTGEFTLVSGGERAYLWACAPDGSERGVATLHGPATLRKLARLILREVPAPRKRKRSGAVM